MTDNISLNMEIEDLVAKFPEAAGFLTRQGVRCIKCGEPVWGTLRELFKEDGVKEPQKLVNELNDYLKKRAQSR